MQPSITKGLLKGFEIISFMVMDPDLSSLCFIGVQEQHSFEYRMIYTESYSKTRPSE